MNTTPATGFADIVTAHLDSVTAAESFADDDLTTEAAQRRRAEMHRNAQTVLSDSIATLTDPGDDPRPAALAAIRATSADSIAAEAREVGIVRDLLAAGRELGKIIANSDATRAAAIYAHRETLALGSTNSEAAADDIAALTFDRLADLGVPEITAAAAAHSTWAVEIAKQEVLKALTSGAVPLGALQTLAQAAPDDYAAIGGVHAAQPILTRSAREARTLTYAVN